MSSESKQPLFQSPVMFAVSLLIFALAMLSLIAAVLDRALTYHVVFFCLIALWLLLGQKLVWKRLSVSALVESRPALFGLFTHGRRAVDQH